MLGTKAVLSDRMVLKRTRSLNGSNSIRTNNGHDQGWQSLLTRAYAGYILEVPQTA